MIEKKMGRLVGALEPFPLADRLYIDVLEERYGPIHAEIRSHDRRVRESFLADLKRIPRTYALTFLAQPLPAEARKVNADIRQGELLGKAFLRHGYDVRKNVIDVSILELPRWLRTAFRAGRHALARSAEFFARKKGCVPFIYGLVTEIYSPDIRPPLINEVDVSQLSAFTPELARNGFKKEQIWERLGRENDWSDVRERHERARVASLPLVFAHRRTIARRLGLPHKRSEFQWMRG